MTEMPITIQSWTMITSANASRGSPKNAELVPNQLSTAAAGPPVTLNISDHTRPVTVTPRTVGMNTTAR